MKNTLTVNLMGMIAAAVLALGLTISAHAEPEQIPELDFRASWVGNSFAGHGKWVQNNFQSLHVTPEGVAIAVTYWDEAGRCIGLHYQGEVNEELLQQYDGEGGHEAWGWGTASVGVTAGDEYIYVVNTEGTLLRFSWDPPDIDSGSYEDQVDDVGEAHDLDTRGDTLAIALTNDQVQIRDRDSLDLREQFELPGVQDVVIAEDNTLWLLTDDGRIVQRSQSGEELPGEITDVDEPISLAIGHAEGKLLVTDDGPRQQIHIYDISNDQPTLQDSFGQEGGVRAGTPGQYEPDKFWRPTGAGADAQGNLYVTTDLTGGGGGVMLRTYDPEGELLWKLESHAFLDTYAVDPAYDGEVIYGVDEVFQYDPESTDVGDHWSLKAITLDHVTHEDDPRYGPRGDRSSTAILRRPEGQRLLFTIGQTSGGYELYTFEDEDSYIAEHVESIGDGGWPWFVDDDSGIWFGGDGGNDQQIEHYPFQGWDNEGQPVYDLDNPRTWDWPEKFTKIARVLYVPETDTMFITGYTEDKPSVSWGLIGSIMVRYDNWLETGGERAWVTGELPTDDEGYHPKSIDVAGDYLFTVTTRWMYGHDACVVVWDKATGEPVGILFPSAPVDEQSGWIDIYKGLQAFQRDNGDYMIIVEENAFAKNIIYHWDGDAH